ncbi:uncharacterized protein LOC143920170 isoform X2 [Arctopsyche grandis]
MDVPKLVQSYVEKLIPASILSETANFRITSDYPEWTDRPDVVITTNRGEFVEIKNRQPVRSCLFEHGAKVDKILLHFNMGKTPDYLLRTTGKLFIVGRENGELKILAKFEDVARMELDDPDVRGVAKIRLWCFDDALPTILDASYREEIRDNVFKDDSKTKQDDERMVSVLLGNLSEARLNTARNRKTYEEKRLFRQKVLHAIGEDNRYNLEDAMDVKGVGAFDKLNIENAWQKINNGKWIIGISIRNVSDGPVDDVELMMIREDSQVLFCTVTFYSRDDDSSFLWKTWKGSFNVGETVTIVAVSDVPEFSFGSDLVVKRALNYRYKGNVFCLPLEWIETNVADVVDDKMNPILCDSSRFGLDDILSLLSSSVAKNLDVHFINVCDFDMKQFFTEKLEYSNSEHFKNIFRHSKSPLHLLHGTVIYVDDKIINKTCIKLCILACNREQILLLLNLMYTKISTRIVIVPSNYSIELKKKLNSEMSTEICSEEMDYSEDSNRADGEKLLEFGTVLHKQVSLVSQHLEKCIEAMSIINVEELTNKSNDSMDIDVLALGLESYRNLWKEIHEQTCIKNDLFKEIVHKIKNT